MATPCPNLEFESIRSLYDVPRFYSIGILQTEDYVHSGPSLFYILFTEVYQAPQPAGTV
jgi:hypothetical protein